MLIDTHCHLTYDDLTALGETLFTRCREAGVDRLITVATHPDDARRALQLLGERPQVFLAAGIHPHEAAKVNDEHLQALADLHAGRWNLAEHLQRRVCAVGETGLDFFYDFAPPERQEEVFRFQLDLAVRHHRPVIIHARNAEGRVCDILSDYPALAGRFVFHCFSADTQMARRILDLGGWLSFTGVVTFRNADEIRAAAQLAPADRYMLETDAPFLSPEPLRKQRPCEPSLVVHTARRVAEVRNMTYEALAAQTTENAERFFGLPAADQRSGDTV